MNIKISNLNICLLLSFAMCNASSINANHSVHLHDVKNMTIVEKESLVTKLISDFLDIAGHPQKNFKDFAHDFITILKSEATNPERNNFCSALEKIKDKQQPKLIGLTLIKYKHLLPKLAQEVLKKKKTDELQVILEYRVNK